MGRKSWQKTLPLKLMNFRDSIVHSCPGHSHSSGHLMRRTLRNHFEHDMLVTEMKEGMSIAKHLKELTDRLAAICAPILQEVQIVTPVCLGATPLHTELCPTSSWSTKQQGSVRNPDCRKKTVKTQVSQVVVNCVTFAICPS